MNKVFQRIVIGVILLIFVGSSLLIYLPRT